MSGTYWLDWLVRMSSWPFSTAPCEFYDPLTYYKGPGAGPPYTQ